MISFVKIKTNKQTEAKRKNVHNASNQSYVDTCNLWILGSSIPSLSTSDADFASSTQQLVVQSEIPYPLHVTKAQIQTSNNDTGLQKLFYSL